MVLKYCGRVNMGAPRKSEGRFSSNILLASSGAYFSACCRRVCSLFSCLDERRNVSTPQVSEEEQCENKKDCAHRGDDFCRFSVNAVFSRYERKSSAIVSAADDRKNNRDPHKLGAMFQT